jgi:long-chain fatty acid transport protein
MRTTTTILALVLLPAVALANGYDVPNVNPRDLSMAGSAVAAQQDAGAAYQNPAALSKIEGLDLSLGGSLLSIDTDWRAPAGSPLAGSPDATTKFRPAPPVSLFAAYGTKLGDRGAGLGFGMNIPGGGNVFWHDDWAGRSRIITVDRKLYGFYLTGGYELLPQVRLGGGVNYVYTTEYLKQGVGGDTSAYGELATRGGGFGYQLSAEITPLASVPLTFGVDYKHKVKMDLSGDGHFVVPDALLQPNPANPTAIPPIDQDVKHVLTFPNILALGAAYRPVKPLLVTVGYTFNRYVVYDADVFVGSKGTTIEVPRNYSNGHTFRLGGEYAVSPRLDVRAGVLRDFSGFKESLYSPTLPDASSWAAALGAGWRIREGLAVNGAFFYALFDEVEQTTTNELQGAYETSVWIASIGLNWRTDLGGGR